MTRFRPVTAKPGSVAYRLVNHTNQAIEGFETEMTCLDAEGRIVEKVPNGQRFGAGLEIPPGGTFEPAAFTQELSDLSRKVQSVQIAVPSVTFVGGGKWEAPMKK